MKLPKDKKVYVIGMAGLEAELKEEGITHIGGTVRLHRVVLVPSASDPAAIEGPR